MIGSGGSQNYWIWATFLAALLCPWFTLVGLIPPAHRSPLAWSAARWVVCVYLYCRLHVDLHLWGPIVGTIATAVGAVRLTRGPRPAPDHHLLLVWTAGGLATVVLALHLPYHLVVRWLVCTWLLHAILNPVCVSREGRSPTRRCSPLTCLFASPPAASGFALGLAAGMVTIHQFPSLEAVGIVGWFALAFALWRRKSAPEVMPRRLTLAYALAWCAGGLLAACLLLEVYFRHVYDATDANAGLHTARLWYTRHVHYNSWGFRDHEYEPLSRFDDHLRVLVLGDSFAFGRGINRDSDLLGPQLTKALEQRLATPQPVTVFNISRDGWTTEEELAVFESAGRTVAPHLVVLVYMLNDVTDSVPFRAARHPTLDGWASLRQRSVFFDFFIWHVYIGGPVDPLNYVPPEVHYYQDDAVFAAHSTGIEHLITTVRAARAELFVVLYPYLIIPAHTGPQRQALDQLQALFARHGVPTLDVSRLADTTDPRYVVNPFDAHPNEELTRIVAQGIAAHLPESALLQSLPPENSGTIP